LSDKVEKKTLGLKSGTLGLSRDTSEKFTLSPSAKREAPTLSKGKVVVVTKARGTTRPLANSSDDGLSEQEKRQRMLLLQQAEANKLKEEELRQRRRREVDTLHQEANTQQPQQTPVVPVVAPTQAAAIAPVNEVNQETPTTVEVAPVAPPVTPKPVEAKAPIKTKEVRRISLAEVVGQGKIRNLDSLYRHQKPEVKEEPKKETADSAQKANQLSNQKAAKPGFTTTLPAVKKKTDEEQDKLALKKAAEMKGKGARKISVSQVMMMDSEDGFSSGSKRRSLASIKRAREKVKRKMFGEQKAQEKIIREVNIPDFITVQDLANRMAEKTTDVIKSLMKLGMMVTVNQAIDADTAEVIVNEFNHKVKRVTEADLESALIQYETDLHSNLISRPPVVTIMGHVDHGKTSLLDALRQTDVATGEAGGITQHIGAYQIKLPNGHLITFLDTPGHEAFTAMRMRGAKVTDIVVLVVAADDGIMQQTIEAISHAKAAKVPIIVAINKIDKPESDPTRVRNELLSHGLVPDDMGGDVMVVEVSAKKKINLDKLEEVILLQAEMLELKANPNRFGEGAVVEAKVEKGKGVIATVLVQKGTLRNSDIIVAGSTWGRIRKLVNDKGVTIDQALPAMPVEIQGLEEAPIAGDSFLAVANEKTARDIVSLRHERDRQKRLVASKSVSLEQLFKKAQATGNKELSVIIKADVQGSVEAIAQSLQKLSGDEISVRILHSAVGGITESDVTLATASASIIVGFNVRANQQARELAKVNGVDIRYYSIIYNLVDDIKAAMSGMLSPVIKEDFLGSVDIRNVITLTKFGKVAGCYVTEGLVKKTANVRIIRDSVVIYDGKLKALKRFKDDVREVSHGFECGLSFENFEDIKVGDKIEVYDRVEHKRTL